MGGETPATTGASRSERDALIRLARLLPSAPPGEVWAGDDAAVLQVPASVPGAGPCLLLAADAVVAGVDADLSLTSLADLGWKAMVVNLSDIAAMGGTPHRAVVSVVGLGPEELEELYSGILEAAGRYNCPVVGGDLSAGEQIVVSVGMTGWVDGSPVLRSGAHPGDEIWVTGPLGGAAGGLRCLRAAGRQLSPPPPGEEAMVRAHARPAPALAEGIAARRAGATAMIDVSDGLAVDLGRLADASCVGFDLAEIPVVPGATLEEALGGGDDYVLVFTMRAGNDAARSFVAAGLAPPYRVGICLAGAESRLLAGKTLARVGWEHVL